MSIGKGLLLLGTTAAVGAMISSGPLLSVTAPILWWGTKSYRIGSLAACGIATALSLGNATGRVMGETGSAVTIQGISEMSQQLAERLKGDKEETKES